MQFTSQFRAELLYLLFSGHGEALQTAGHVAEALLKSGNQVSLWSTQQKSMFWALVTNSSELKNSESPHFHLLFLASKTCGKCLKNPAARLWLCFCLVSPCACVLVPSAHHHFLSKGLCVVCQVCGVTGIKRAIKQLNTIVFSCLRLMQTQMSLHKKDSKFPFSNFYSSHIECLHTHKQKAIPAIGQHANLWEL